MEANRKQGETLTKYKNKSKYKNKIKNKHKNKCYR